MAQTKGVRKYTSNKPSKREAAEEPAEDEDKRQSEEGTVELRTEMGTGGEAGDKNGEVQPNSVGQGRAIYE